MKAFTLCLLLLASPHFNAQSTAGDILFNDNTIHTININFSQGNYWSLLVANKSFDDSNDTSTYIPASVIIDGTLLDSVGIQFKGNSSYYNYPSNKKPFTLAFNEYIPGQDYDGLKNINLNNMYQDPAFMREKLFLDFCNEKGIYAPRANYAKLYINGSYSGLYLMVERINKTFVKDRFLENDGNLFKGDNGNGACADLKYNGPSQTSYYSCYDLKTNKTTNDWSDLVNLTYQINNTSDMQFRDSLEAVLNTNSFINAWAAYNLFVDFDSYPYRFIHNYYIYHDTASDQFQWIVWDASTAFGMDVPGSIASIESTSVLYVTPSEDDRPLVKRMLDNDTLKANYLNTVCSFANNDFLPAVLNPKIDTLYSRIQNDVYSDPLKMYTDAEFNTNVNSDLGSTPGLKSFISNRSASVLGELTALGFTNCPAITTAALEDVQNELQITLYPNPVSTTFFIEGNFEIPSTLEIKDATGKTVYTVKLIGNEQEINVEELKSGIYFYHVNSSQSVGSYAGKLIVE